jgi:hypothetical protein
MIRTLGIGVLVVSMTSVTGNAHPYKRLSEANSRGQEKTPPGVAITPGSLDFGDRATKTPSNPQRLTITNTGEKDLYVNSAAIADGDKEDFVIAADSCTGATVAAHKSCTVAVKFVPSVTGVRKATLVLMDNAGDSPQNVVLRGNGINSVRVRPNE